MFPGLGLLSAGLSLGCRTAGYYWLFASVCADSQAVPSEVAVVMEVSDVVFLSLHSCGDFI